MPGLIGRGGVVPPRWSLAAALVASWIAELTPPASAQVAATGGGANVTAADGGSDDDDDLLYAYIVAPIAFVLIAAGAYFVYKRQRAQVTPDDLDVLPELLGEVLHTVTGKVRDKATGAGVAAVKVITTDGSKSTKADAKGNFTMKLPSGTYELGAVRSAHFSESR